MGEKGEGFTPHLMVILARREVDGGGGSTAEQGRRRCGSPAAMFQWGKEGADGSESFRRAMGFHFRGWFGAWMAGVGSSTVSLTSSAPMAAVDGVWAREGA